MKIIPGTSVLQKGPNKLTLDEAYDIARRYGETLDEAYDIARRYGEVEIGGAFGSASRAKINLRNSKEHHLYIYSSEYSTPQENLMECVAVCERILGVL